MLCSFCKVRPSRELLLIIHGHVIEPISMMISCPKFDNTLATFIISDICTTSNNTYV